MNETFICSAVGTPLAADDTLHVEGLRAHLEDQRTAGINGVLVAGTMGAMQLLTGRTYEKLVRQCASDWNAGELLVGVGDLSFARTRERLQIVNELKVDGAVVLSPFFLTYSQSDLIEYFESVACESRAPVYLYDLPQRTGVVLEVETVARLAEHPNIAGIKCSGRNGASAATLRHVARLQLQGHRCPIDDDRCAACAGFRQHVDGIYCIVPKLVREITAASADNDWELAAKKTRILNDFLMVIVKYGVFPAMTAVLNWRGIPGNYAPRPHRPLSPRSDRTAVGRAGRPSGIPRVLQPVGTT